MHYLGALIKANGALRKANNVAETKPQPATDHVRRTQHIMTVRELLRKLSVLNPDATVLLAPVGYCECSEYHDVDAKLTLIEPNTVALEPVIAYDVYVETTGELTRGL